MGEKRCQAKIFVSTGLSGTPPCNILYTDPVGLVPAESATGRRIRTYRIAGDDD